MPDIAMCLHPNCPNSKSCRRHKDSGTVPNPEHQTYAAFLPFHTKDGRTISCQSYYPVPIKKVP